MIHVVSVSGGKDSTAAWIWAKRQGFERLVAVFCDTKWEADFDKASTYQYLDEIEKLLGPIIRLDSEGFEARTRRGGTFPGRVRKWCSPELKIDPFKAWLNRFVDETGDDVTVIVGIRAEEGSGRGDKNDRSIMSEREWSENYDCEVWRPIIRYTIAEVVAEHQRAGVPLNPLYHLGAERVGCWPCVHAGKNEIRLVSELDPARIDLIEKIETDVGFTMFALEESRAGKAKGAPRKVVPTPIRQMVDWSKTKRGGKQLAVLPAAAGCARWGICEAVPR